MDVSKQRENEPHSTKQLDQMDERETQVILNNTRVSVWKEPPSNTILYRSEQHQYNVVNAWKSLFKLPSCQQMLIKAETQKRLQIMVGINVSQEFPWKQIRFKHLREYLFDEVENGDQMRKAFYGFDIENHVLMGYAPLLTQNQDDLPDGDPFILFINTEDTKTALATIQNIERYERWVLTKRLVKNPRRWVSLGSEDEVNLTLQQRRVEPVDVEIQGVYPLTISENKELNFRKSGDVRDGYIELVPSESMKFDNVMRRRINVAIQSAPDLVNTEQQTNPTFPTNAWAQYHYEIDDADDALDMSSIEEEKDKDKERTSSTPNPNTPLLDAEPAVKSPVELSDQMKLLLDTLDFNQIDMYRSDYPYLSNRVVAQHSIPFLEETLCFANISKSNSRFVCGLDWYPKLSGLIVTSYTFDTRATVTNVSTKVDWVQRAVLQPNPILMWSFSDNLNYKLEFESPLEITTLSFCPHDPNLLFGGAKNGQILIWDLQNRAEKLDLEEVLTSAQSRYRIVINDFLKWTIQIDEDAIVPPATITSLEVSQKGAITGFSWVGSNFYVNNFGKIYKSLDKNVKYKYFMTSSIDGTISFWNLSEATEKKAMGGGYRRELPRALTQSESAYKNKVLKPIFTVVYIEPITTIISDTPIYNCVVMDPAARRKNPLNYRTDIVEEFRTDMRQSVIMSSFYGHIERINWVGSFADADGRESVNISVNFARVHDGPVIAMQKNPFMSSIFASIGRNVFAVWKDDYPYSPIFWRKRSCDLTTVAWSGDRPTVLFLTRIDGNFEAWDILARDDDACLNDILGGGIVTAIAEHGPTEPEKLLGIGDYNSSFRMVRLPPSFYISAPNDLKNFRAYMLKEEERKKSIQAWEQDYYEHNRDVIEAKREAEIETRKELERIEKEAIFNATRKKKEDEDDSINQPPINQSYTERMKRHWDELNLNRMMSILMTRKRVNAVQLERDTAMEKRRLNYEAAKKDSLAQIMQHVAEEVAAVRARILPAEKVDLERNVMIVAAVVELMQDIETYESVEEEAVATMEEFEDFDTLDYITFLHRGRDRRRIINKSLGGNTERQVWYYQKIKNDQLGECNWGYEQFINANIDFATQGDVEEHDKTVTGTLHPTTKDVQPSAIEPQESLKTQIEKLEETLIE